ncbi:MAG: phosphoenolpyruvate--protein phosphotransferase [Bacillota bacterium]|nr:phosphoenolpyruvate--protein phosphotransferase [Bacillota bacterium]
MRKGIAASKGYAIGKVFLKEQDVIVIAHSNCIDVIEEKKRLKRAVEEARNQLIHLRDKTGESIGKEESVVFESHLILLDDPEFIGAASAAVERDNTSAEAAVKSIVDMYLAIFSDMEDEYIKERAADIKDVGNRLLRNLMGRCSTEFPDLPENTVVVAHDLVPSDTAQLDRRKVIAFLTDIGGRTSHSAIIARMLEIPAVVGLQDITSRVKNGDTVIVDGAEGVVIINPQEDTLKLYEDKRVQLEIENDKLKGLIDKKAVTRAGRNIAVAGNIGSVEDVHKVIENGGEGVGLFRTEFLYMDREELPTEEEQFLAYKYVAEKLEGRPLIIRTLDIGGDKRLPYLPMPEEINPFLGYRAIRLCLDRQDVFKTQLRAILRASVFGKVKIMFPMISALKELIKAKEVLWRCMEELKTEEKPFNEAVETGIMIEVPSAAIMADELAGYVDFFSIGTNDLVQYTLAADRMNEKIAYLYDPMHPAVLRLIKMTIDAAHREGKWCGMCGEMAGDEEAIPTLMEYGLDEFSVSAPYILRVKQKIINS